MTLVRLFLGVVGAASLAAGAVFLVAPDVVAEIGELGIGSPVARIEVRGFYGGQLVGLGLGILAGAWRRGFVVPALMLVVVPLAGTALGRVIGVIAEGELPMIIAALLAAEIGTAAIGGFFLRRELRQNRPV